MPPILAVDVTDMKLLQYRIAKRRAVLWIPVGPAYGDAQIGPTARGDCKFLNSGVVPGNPDGGYAVIPCYIYLSGGRGEIVSLQDNPLSLLGGREKTRTGGGGLPFPGGQGNGIQTETEGTRFLKSQRLSFPYHPLPSF